MNGPDTLRESKHVTKRVSLGLLVFLLCVSQIVAQRRAAATPKKVTPTSDALVLGDRTWVYYLAPKSTALRRLAKGNFPALSPDGKLVAYCSPLSSTRTGQSVTLMLFDLASGKTSSLFESNGYLKSVQWSPDGKKILFSAAYLNAKRELAIIGADGSGKQKVIATGEQGVTDVFVPVWAPDGQSIYFQEMNNLVQVGVDGSVLKKTPLGQIIEEKESVTSADSFVPSPTDPNILIYTRPVPGTKLFERTFGEPNTALFSYNAQTKARKRLTPVDLLALDPAWSRDGRFIYFSGYRDREGRGAQPFRIYRINPDGSGLVEIIRGENPGT